ncbi:MULTISPECIES: hypothetical protein [Bradyrhizobium]|uniref:hypothetical protein n=1 Tax=Bradyrhizobium TaxID=374 RepID=UPI001BA9B717|nr:hypothetical protein [Bradyrhizobium liaoningense]MBR0987785.1 hypothetical protein [Bradyrhizobium liaoningense]
MSAKGHKRPFDPAPTTSGLPLSADVETSAGGGRKGRQAERRLGNLPKVSARVAQPLDVDHPNEACPRMRLALKIALVAICAAILTAVLLIIVLAGIFGMQGSRTLQILSSAPELYLLPTIIFVEFCFLTNDLLAYLCKKFELDFGINFSEIPFKFDLDKLEAPIPLRTKLVQLYPLTILLTLLGFAVALMTRQ